VAENLELISSDPQGEGWLIKIKLDDALELDNLLSASEYEKLVAEEAEEEDEDSDLAVEDD
jgi:glycine cleavage system H protein